MGKNKKGKRGMMIEKEEKAWIKESWQKGAMMGSEVIKETRTKKKSVMELGSENSFWTKHPFEFM